MEIYVGGSILHHLRFGQGQEIIFLHGWGGSTASFLGVAKVLSQKYTVTLVDFYGFGQTPHPDHPLFIEDYAKAVVEIINYYKMNNVNVVAHSFGGRVAIRLASKYGYLLNKVVIADGAGVLPKRGVRYYYKVFRHKVLRKLHIKHRSGSDDYNNSPIEARETFKNVVNEDLSKEMSKITLPVLLFWGNKDKDTPIYMAKTMLRKMSDSALIELIGAGHFSYLEAQGLFLRIVDNFLGGVYEMDSSGRISFSNRDRVIKIPLFDTK